MLRPLPPMGHQIICRLFFSLCSNQFISYHMMGYVLCRRPLSIVRCSQSVLIILWTAPCAAGPRQLLIAFTRWILSHLDTDIGILGARTCHLACVVPPLWHLEGPWDKPRPQEKDTLRSRFGFLFRFWVDFESLFWDLFRASWPTKGGFFHACFQVAFSNGFWVRVWLSGAPKTRIVSKGYYTAFSHILEFPWVKSRFYGFGWP